MFNNFRNFPLFIQVTIIFSFAMLVPAYYAHVLDLVLMKQAFLRAFVLVTVISYLIGTLLIERKTRGDLKEHLFSVVIIYLFLPLVLAIPIWESIPWLNFWQGSYEMYSSLTTTGASLITSTSRYQMPLLIYTTIVSWLGGFLILLVAFSIFEPSKMGGFELISELSSDARTRSIGGKVGRSNRLVHYIKILAPPYIIITLLCYLVLAMNGERSLFAFVQAMSAVSTSGLDPYFGARPPFNIYIVELALFAVMLFGVSRIFWFNVYSLKRPKALNEDPEIRAFLLILILFISATLISYVYTHVTENRVSEGVLDFANAVWGTIFTGVSFLTTHGVMSEFWQIGLDEGQQYIPNIALLGLVLIGGGVATTAAGVKLLRIYALYKLSTREVARLIDPHAIAASGRAGRNLRRSGAITAIVYLILFIVAMIVGVFVLTFFGMGFEEAVLTAIMSVSNCGPVLDLYPNVLIEIRNMHHIFYIVSAFLMIVGRIEVLIFATIINVAFWRDL